MKLPDLTIPRKWLARDFTRRALAAVALTVAILLSSTLHAQIPLNMKYAGFRGSDEVLLRAPGITITEADLFRYVVLTGGVDLKFIAERQKLTENEKIILRGLLDQIVYTELIAPRYAGEDSAVDVDFAVRGQRILAGGAAQLLWADKVVRDTIRVFPEDVIHQFKTNKAEYTAPASATVRRLRVPTAGAATLATRTQALSVALALRERARQGGGLEPLLRENPEWLMDPPGRLMTLSRATPNIDPQIVDEVFTLSVSQISRPIQTPAGYILLEVVERREAQQVQMSAVLPAIKADLVDRLLPQQHQYLLFKRYIKSYPIDRSRLYEFMPGDADILSVGEFALTVDEFNRLFPDLVGDPNAPNKLGIAAKTLEIITAEIAARDLEKRGLIGDPFYQQASEMAGKLFRSSQYIRAERAKVNPTEAEVKSFLLHNPEKIMPGPTKVVWSLRLTSRGEGMNRQELETLQILMQNTLGGTVQEARKMLAEARAALKPEETIEPDKVLRGISQPSDSRMRLKIESVGAFSNFDAQANLGIPYEALVLGEVTSPFPLRDGSVVSYFVSEEREPKKIPEAQLLKAARTQLIIKTALKEPLDLVEQWKQDGSLVYAKSIEPQQ